MRDASSPTQPAPSTIQGRLAAFAGWVPGASTAIGLYQRDRRHAGSVLAAGLAFRLFLMILPLGFLVASAAGFLAEKGTDAVTADVHTIGITGLVAQTIGQSATESRGGRWLLLVIGLGLLVYTASGLYRALQLIHLVVWQERPARTGPVPTIAVSAAVIGLFALGSVVSAVDAALPGATLGLEILIVAVAAGAWLLVMRLLPHGQTPWRALLPGALAVGVGLGVMHLVTVLYVPHKLASTSRLYGSFGVAATLMAWLFLTCRLLVASAALNVTLWERGWVLGGARSPG